MKIQCDVCERAEAAVLCCADEAALCWGCDEKVHAANKLAGKHQRVPLLLNHNHTHPSCDICQEKAGYFFCLEDRALLCRQCDVSIHTASPYVSSHQRFLVTGAKVALQCAPNNNENTTNSNSNSSNGGNYPLNSNSPASNTSSADHVTDKKCRVPATTAVATSVTTSGDPYSAVRPHWPLDEILTSADFDHCYGFSELGVVQD